jgi:hypothetical protein
MPRLGSERQFFASDSVSEPGREALRTAFLSKK